MTTDTYAPSAVGERIKDLCRQFRLPTLAGDRLVDGVYEPIERLGDGHLRKLQRGTGTARLLGGWRAAVLRSRHRELSVLSRRRANRTGGGGVSRQHCRGSRRGA